MTFSMSYSVIPSGRFKKEAKRLIRCFQIAIMRRRYDLFLLSCFAFCACKNEVERNSTNDVQSLSVFKKIVQDTVFYKNGGFTKTNLYDVNYIGELPSKVGKSYIIVSGTDCDECDENTSIYVFSAKRNIIEKNGLERYSFPGKEYNIYDTSLEYESRVFFGNCLSDTSESIAWFEKRYKKDVGVDSSIFVLELVRDSLIQRTINGGLLKPADMKHCKEVEGRDFSSEP